MTRDDDPQHDDLQDESCQLKAGLKSCRKVVASYREMLTGSSSENPMDEGAEIRTT